MDAPDGQVPGPRRPALPRLRPAADPTALPFAAPAADAPRVADLSALLGDIDALRLTLQTDLSLAAAALDEGAQDLAAELVDSDLFEVRAFADRAAERLDRLARLGNELDGRLGADLENDLEDAPAEVLPALVPARRRRRVLSAAPLMAAAAALVGFVVLGPAQSAPAPAPEATLTSAALAGYELSRLASEGAPDEQLREAAEELNDELAVLIAQAAEDPAAAQQALMLLDQTTQVLASQGDSGVLRGVMAETRALRERLQDTLPKVVKRPIRPVVRPALPVDLPRVQQQQQQPAPEKERSASSTPPKSSPKPASSPKPSPSPTTSSAPAPAPASDPSPKPSGEPNGPLPNGEDLPGA